MKIIQIAVTVSGDLYGLDDNGGLYLWGLQRAKLKNPTGDLDDEGKPITHVYKRGWQLRKDEIND